MELNRPVSVFLVDDDEMYLKSIEHFLNENSEHKYDITTYSTGEKCLENLDDNPDIIVLDYYLDSVEARAKTGLEILKSIKSKKSKAQVVMLTKEDSIEIAKTTMDSGAFDYVVKTDTAFHRLQNNVNNIIKNIALAAFLRFQKKYTYGTLAALGFTLIYSLFVHGWILKMMGVAPR